MNKQLFLILSFILWCGSLCAQTTNYHGIVVDQQGKPIDIFDIACLRADSSMLTGRTFSRGTFSIDVPQEAVFLMFRALGYNALRLPVSALISTNSSSDTITLTETPLQLGEVVVEARKPMVRLNGDAYTIDVQKTYLEKVGTFIDVARRIPGLVVSARGGIAVMGKPRLLINLNGRAVRNMSELEALQSQQIKYISIDRNPSTAFAADYDAVIDVVTKATTADHLLFVATNNLTMSRAISDNTAATFNGKTQRLAYFTDLRFGIGGTKQYDTEDKHVWNNDQHLYTHRQSNLTSNAHFVRFKQSVEFLLRPNTALGLAYQLVSTKQDIDKQQAFSMARGSIRQDIPTTSNNDSRKTEHNPSFLLTARGKKSSLGVFADYYSATQHNTQNVLENLSHNVRQNFKDHYDVYGLKADYTHTLPFLTYTTGVKATYIKDKGTYASADNTSQASQLETTAYAAYLNLRKAIGHFTLTAGLRLESEHSKSTQNANIALDTTANNWFPYIAVAYQQARLKTSISYSRRIYRPTYGQLIIKNVYIDPLSYSIGNPLLRSTLTDILTLSLQKGNFVGSLSYEHHRNKRVQVAQLEEDAQQRVRFTYDNIPHAHRIQAYAMYNYALGNMRGHTAFTISASRFAFNGSHYATFNRIGVNARTTLETPLWAAATLLCTASYHNEQQADFYLLRPSFNFSLHFSQDLWKKRLRLTLSAEDVFKTIKANNWTQQLQQARITMNTNADSRMLVLSLRYMFGRSKAKSQSRSAIQEETDRL